MRDQGLSVMTCSICGDFFPGPSLPFASLPVDQSESKDVTAVFYLTFISSGAEAGVSLVVY